MIHIIIDTFKLTQSSKNDILVEDEDKYIKSRLEIRKCSQNNKSLTVIVRNSKMSSWFKSLESYPSVVKEHHSPKRLLERKIGTTVYLEDKEIMQLDLLAKIKENPPKQSIKKDDDITNWILSSCVNECWGETGGTPSHFSNIVAFYLSQKEPSESVLKKLANEKKERFKLLNNMRAPYKWLFEDPRDGAFTIYTLKVIENYNKALKDSIIAGLSLKQFESIEEYIAKIPSISCGDTFDRMKELNDIIQIKWKNFLKDSFKTETQEESELLKEKFKSVIYKAVTEMSGQIEGEIKSIEYFIQENAKYFSIELWNLLDSKFPKFKKHIEKLKVPPRIPDAPKKDWDWDTISNWALNEYFPYKKWLQSIVQADSHLEECMYSYSDWLFENYPKLKNELYPLVYGTWDIIKKHINDGYQILWLIIDNLAWFYVDDLIGAFKEQGLNLSSNPIARLSMLPSETKISKVALVAGKLRCQIDIYDYERLFTLYCKDLGVKSQFIKDKDLKRGSIGNHDITCCIINKFDVSAHKGDFDLEDDIKSALERYAEYTTEFISNSQSREKLKIIISTDHGSCVIPSNARKYKKLPKAAQEGNKRYVIIEDRESINDDWYYLHKEAFGLYNDAAIPKGYGFIGDRTPEGLVHGGMSPEETIIPHLEFSPKPHVIEDIKCIHTGNPIIISSKPQKVELCFRNTNDHEITSLNIFIPSHSKTIRIDSIPSKDERHKIIELALTRENTITKESKVCLKTLCKFYCLGQERNFTFDILINKRILADTSGSADDLLFD